MKLTLFASMAIAAVAVRLEASDYASELKAYYKSIDTNNTNKLEPAELTAALKYGSEGGLIDKNAATVSTAVLDQWKDPATGICNVTCFEDTMGDIW
jgi:hypothetical protein